jgi:outer membrane protein assembly factor BamB
VDAPSVPGLAAGDGLVFVSAPAAIEARAAADGSVRWRVPIDGDVTGGLTWDQGWLLAVTSRGTAIAIRARDGQTIWQQPAGAAASVAPALGADRAYLVLDDGRVQSRRLLTGDLVWERKLGGRPAQLLPLDDRIFVGSRDRFFYCLATKDGDVKWRWRAGGDVIGAHRRRGGCSWPRQIPRAQQGNGHQRWRQLLATGRQAASALRAASCWLPESLRKGVSRKGWRAGRGGRTRPNRRPASGGLGGQPVRPW